LKDAIPRLANTEGITVDAVKLDNFRKAMAKILKQEAEAFSLKRKREWLGDEYGVYSPRNQRDRNKVDVKPFNRDIDILLKILSVATCRSHSISTRKDHLPPTYLQKKRSRTHATSAAAERAKWDSQVRLFLLFKSHGVVGKSFAILYVCALLIYRMAVVFV